MILSNEFNLWCYFLCPEFAKFSVNIFYLNQHFQIYHYIYFTWMVEIMGISSIIYGASENKGSKGFATWYLNRNENGVLFENLYLNRQMFFFFSWIYFRKTTSVWRDSCSPHTGFVRDWVVLFWTARLAHLTEQTLQGRKGKTHYKMVGQVEVFDKQS